MKKLKAFTLVELVIVIVLLGILSAVALPRFVNLKDSAWKARKEAYQGALQSGLNLANSTWYAKGKPATLEINEKTLTFSDTGFPKPDDDDDDEGCMDIFLALMQIKPTEIDLYYNCFGATGALSQARPTNPLDIPTRCKHLANATTGGTRCDLVIPTVSSSTQNTIAGGTPKQRIWISYYSTTGETLANTDSYN